MFDRVKIKQTIASKHAAYHAAAVCKWTRKNKVAKQAGQPFTATKPIFFYWLVVPSTGVSKKFPVNDSHHLLL